MTWCKTYVPIFSGLYYDFELKQLYTSIYSVTYGTLEVAEINPTTGALQPVASTNIGGYGPTTAYCPKCHIFWVVNNTHLVTINSITNKKVQNPHRYQHCRRPNSTSIATNICLPCFWLRQESVVCVEQPYGSPNVSFCDRPRFWCHDHFGSCRRSFKCAVAHFFRDLDSSFLSNLSTSQAEHCTTNG